MLFGALALTEVDVVVQLVNEVILVVASDREDLDGSRQLGLALDGLSPDDDGELGIGHQDRLDSGASYAVLVLDTLPVHHLRGSVSDDGIIDPACLVAGWRHVLEYHLEGFCGLDVSQQASGASASSKPLKTTRDCRSAHTTPSKRTCIIAR